MRRGPPFVFVAALWSTLLVACSQGESDEPTSGDQGLAVGEAAPSFTLPSAAGGSVSLSDFKGKPVLLYFSMGPG